MASSSSVSITYVPADCGSIIPGKSKAPRAFQDVEIARKLREAGIPSVTEHHALDAPARYAVSTFAPGGIRNQDVNLEVCERVYKTISQNLHAAALPASSSQQPAFQLILGGECCMSPAIVSAFWHHHHSTTTQSSPNPKRVGLIYIDADTDLASPTDPASTGVFAGMNMTHLLGLPGALPRLTRQFSRQPRSDNASSETDAQHQQQPVCDASNTVLFGINTSGSCVSNRPEHLGYLSDNGFKVISSAAVAQAPEQQARDALGYLESQGCEVVLVHLDVDAIDPLEFPLANVPNYTGVSFEKMMAAVAVLLASDKVAGLTVAEVNPDHDPGLEMVGRLTEEVVGMLARR